MTGEGLIESGRWRAMSDQQKALLRRQLAEKLAQQGKGMCPYATPGDMALALDRNQVQRPHLEQIDEAFRAALAGEVDRIFISVPPQTGKSVRAGVWGPFWWLAHRPRSRIIVACYGTGLANSRGRSVRRLVEEHGEPLGLHLDPRTTAANDWALTSTGGMRSVGVGSGLTGHPADFAIVDDPIKDRIEADSPTIRENIHEWWSSTLVSRLSPGVPALVVQTRWHMDDLGGRLMKEEGRIEEGGRWKAIELPALAIDHPTYEDGRRRCPCPEGVPHDPLGRLPGEPLPHPRIALDDVDGMMRHWEDKRRSSTVRDWAALYQADPVPAEGALVDAETLRRQRFYGEPITILKSAVAIDPAGGGKDEVGIVGGHYAADKRLYWAADRSGRFPSDVWPRRAVELAVELDADVIVCERNFSGDQAKTLIGLAWEQLQREGKTGRRLKPRIVEVHAKKGKLLRAEPIAQALVEDKIRMLNPLPDVESEWVTWMPDSPYSPGRVDASTYLAYQLLPISGAEALISSPTKSTRDVDGYRSSLTKQRVVGRPTASRAAAGLRLVPDLRLQVTREDTG